MIEMEVRGQGGSNPSPEEAKAEERRFCGAPRGDAPMGIHFEPFWYGEVKVTQ